MVRPKNKPRNIGKTSDRQIIEAAWVSFQDNNSTTAVAKAKGIPFQILRRYVKKIKPNQGRDISMRLYCGVHKLFAKKQERDLSNHIRTFRKMCYGPPVIALL
jgi:hypothetical protein